MLKTPIGRLRAVGLSEGVSFLLLLGVAMPLKYMAGLPIFVKVVGWVHGGLFVLFCIALVHAATKHRWPLLRTGQLLLASLIPFGTFLVDGSLAREDERSASSAASTKV
jgi:integral membrane protein